MEKTMSTRKIVTLIVAGALALVGIGGAFAFTKVSAQAAEPQATQAPSAAQQPLTDPLAQPDTLQGFTRGGQPGGAQETNLAKALGITLEQLQAAYQTANTEALKEAVSKGLITQAQADQITANGLPNHPLREFGGPGTTGIDYDALLAKALGITTDQLKSARQQVEMARLDAAVASGQMNQAQADEMKAREALAGDAKFQASMKTSFEASVAQAVSDGIITQAQADQIIKNNTGMPFLGGAGGHGGRGGHGRGGPDGFGPQSQPTNPIPPTGN
jgi:hypothetical protein